jgi:carbon-monoxide dehydrogenase medium subunit
MKMPQFEYACPSTIQEAVRILADNDGAKIIAGGQSLIPLLAFRMAYPSMLVDIRKLEGLSEIRVTEDGLRVGARVRWCQIEEDERLVEAHPLFQHMINHVAHYQIRNRGTVGGSLAHADPAAEMPGVAMVCDCEMVAVGPNGSRIVKAGDFFTGALETVLEPDEILTEVQFPPWPKARRWGFQEFARRRGDFAIAGVAAFYDLDEQRKVRTPHVGVIGMGSTPQRLQEVEAFLAGKTIDEAVILRAQQLASHVVEPGNDIHAGADYRKSLVGTLTARALRDAMTR